MAIPESQLTTWAHQGAIAQSSDTYNQIKSTLESTAAPYAGKSFRVFLQGSYRNNTNIYAESDVDVVIQLDECFCGDVANLSSLEKSAYASAFQDAKYSYKDFKRDVLEVLQTRYGPAIRVGDKAIAIEAQGSRRKADVIVAIQFRKYTGFRGEGGGSYVEGMCFLNGANEKIVNYPQKHYENLGKKHRATRERLKPLVRIFKNVRHAIADKGLIKLQSIPSYFIEGLLYNVPNEKLVGSYAECMVHTFNWYRREATKNTLVCANEQSYLFGERQHTCWQQASCDAFIDAAVGLWNGWRQRNEG